MIRFPQFTILFLAVALCGHSATVNAQDKEEDETSSFKGKLFRSDTNKPIANANITVEKHHLSYGTHTDAEGNFIFYKVAPGEYTLSISIIYNSEKDAPCQFLIGKLKEEKYSSAFVIPKENKKVYLIFIKNLVLEPEQNITKDYDLVCVNSPGG